MSTARLTLAVIACSLLAAPSFAKDRRVDVVNKTGYTMTSFYASSVDEESWEEDMLANDTLEDGETLEADIDDGTDACIYDFRADFSDGSKVVKRKVNVCEVATFTFLP